MTIRTAYLASLLLLSASSATRASAAEPQPGPSGGQLYDRRMREIQSHERMAALHIQAAACLKSGRTLDDCRDEMLKDCPVARYEECRTLSTPALPQPSRDHEQAGTQGH